MQNAFKRLDLWEQNTYISVGENNYYKVYFTALYFVSRHTDRLWHLKLFMEYDNACYLYPL